MTHGVYLRMVASIQILRDTVNFPVSAQALSYRCGIIDLRENSKSLSTVTMYKR
jgi:hypothetical protein